MCDLKCDPLLGQLNVNQTQTLCCVSAHKYQEMQYRADHVIQCKLYAQSFPPVVFTSCGSSILDF